MTDKEYKNADPDLEGIDGIVLAGPAYEVWVFGYKKDKYIGDQFIGEYTDPDKAIQMAQIVESSIPEDLKKENRKKVNTIEIVVEKVYDIACEGEFGEEYTETKNVNTLYYKTVEVS